MIVVLIYMNKSGGISLPFYAKQGVNLMSVCSPVKNRGFPVYLKIELSVIGV